MAERAEQVLEDIARRYGTTATADGSLAGGAAGVALFRAYLAEHRDSDADREAAVGLAEDAVAVMIEAGDPGISLYEGLTGAAWVLAHLDGWVLDLGEDDPCDVIDDAVLRTLGQTTWAYDYDLISGLVGLGVYGLERLPRPAARAILEAVTVHLAGLAERCDDHALTWRTPPHLLPDHQRASAPDGHYNLGVAHGVPGVAALLAGVQDAGAATDLSGPLLDGAVTWLLGQRLAAGSPSSFASCVIPGMAPEPARSAWCYGDPGVAVAIRRAGEVVARPAWAGQALDIARLALDRPEADSGVNDAGLCHGAAGLAHIYNRLWQSTGDPAFADGARRWIDRTLELQAATEDNGFLEGSAGVGLMLLGALGVDPAWDRILLLSGPRRDF